MSHSTLLYAMLFRMLRSVITILVLLSLISQDVDGLSSKSIRLRSFVYSKQSAQSKPKLILIGGCPGTGKSTFGMSLALEQGILKCISTDTVRAVMRSYATGSINPALNRSSYAPSSENDDPVLSWKETCSVLEKSVEGLIDDAIARKTSIVLEGVSISPSKKWLEKWEAAGGVACGVLLTVSKEEVHKWLLRKRGFITGQKRNEEKKLKCFDRVRLIQEEMIKLAKECGWVLIDQKVELDPLDLIALKLDHSDGDSFYDNMVPSHDDHTTDENVTKENITSILGLPR